MTNLRLWSLVDRLRQYGESAPDQPAIDFRGAGGSLLSRGGWDAGARAVAAHLRPGTRVLVLLPSGADFFVAFAGALYAGACAVPAVPPVQGRAPFIEQALDAEIDAVVTTSAIAEVARPLWTEAGAPAVRWVRLDELEPHPEQPWTPPRVGPDDLALLQYTSGSTGAPKGVAVSHQVLTTWVDVLAERVALPAGSAVVTWVPAHHVLGLSLVLMAPELDGTATLFTPEDVLAEPMRWLGAVSAASSAGVPVLSGAPPFGYQHCVATVTPAQRAELDLSGWEVAVIGSERIRPKVLDEFAEAFAPAGFRPTAFFTGYGTTEMMMGCAHRGPRPPLRLTVDAARLEHRTVVPASRDGGDRTVELVACGPPGAGLDVVIVDPDTRTRCPDGTVGELWLRGPAVATGYWRRPEQTEQTFRARLADGSGPYLRTGDLAFDHHGELVICGRLSELIIIRGRNLIPHDIESTVRATDPALGDAPVAAFSVEVDSGESLVVVAAVDEIPDPDHLASRVRRAVITGHEVDPHAVYLVGPGQIPLTPTGKVRHRACRQSYLDEQLAPLAAAGAGVATHAEEPPAAGGRAGAQRAEAAVRQRIAELVGDAPERVPVDAPLVQLGLDSMAMIKLRAVLAGDFGTEVPMEQLAGLTVTALAAELAGQAGPAVRDGSNLADDAPGEARLVPDPVHRHQPFPLTELQHAYLVGRSGGYPLGGVGTHFYAEFDTSGLDLDRLHTAWCRLVERHDMLRAVVSSDGEQHVLPSVEVPPFRTVDLRGASAERAAAAAARVTDELSHQVFGPDSWPLYEIRVTRLPGGVDRLHVSLDLLVLDVWSLHVLSREWRLHYAEPDTELPPLTATFRDYVLAAPSSADPAAQRYWQDRLDSLPPGPDLPLRRSPASVTEPPTFVRRHDRLDAAKWTTLTELATQAGVTPSAVLLAGYATVLGAWNRRSRFTLNLPTFNRLPLHEEIGSVIGDFTSVTLLEVDLAGDGGVAGLARRLQGQLWRDLEHRSYNGVQVLRELARRRGPDAGILAPVVFSSASGQTTDGTRDLPLSWLGEQVFGVSQTPQVVVDHQLIEVDGGLEYNWDTVDELFAAGTVDDMFAAYQDLLHRLARGDQDTWHGADPSDLLPAAHRNLVEQANDTVGPVPDGLLHERLLAQAQRAPDRTAVLADDAELTFGELHRHASALAVRLRAAGVEPNHLVAVSLPKGAAQVVAVLGVLLAGGAYLPVDPELPAARQDRLLELGGCALVVCAKQTARTDWSGSVTEVVLDLAGDPAWVHPPEVRVRPDDLAYVIFTSGSTGAPKGVAVSHRAALNTCVDVCERFQVGQDDRVLGLSSLSFDLSVWDVFGLLGAGGALVLPSTRDRRDAGRWLELVHRHRVTIWNSVPALAQMYADYPREPDRGDEPIRLALLSGDWIPVGLPDRLHTVAPDCRVVSLGGATEAAIWSICYEIDAVDPAWESIPYGRPMRNQRFHVLNERGQECPVHVVGELHIAGTGLAAGYHGDQARTSASFVPHPITGERLYRTGDLGRWRADGTIEFLGREDFQVKVGGYRIELGEIESAITGHPGVRSAVVAALGDRHHRRLAACLVPATEAASGPRTAGQLNPDAVAESDRAEMIFDELERVEFKLARRGVRTDLSGEPVPLAAPGTGSSVPTRASRRRYADRPVPVTDLGRLLQCLRSHDGAAMPKYGYASAGNTYAVQTYLHVTDGKVAGLAGGTYYHDPVEHRLVPIQPGARLSERLRFGADQHALDTAAFTVFLVADLNAVRPLYGAAAARDLCLIETGLMAQLLEDNAVANDVGLCQLTVVAGAATLRDPLRLVEGHEVLHALLGGALLRAAERPAEPDHPGADPALAESVRGHLAERLPDYMVPAQLVVTENLPLTPTGKVDRGALEHLVAASGQPVDSSPPAGELEIRIAEVFKEVLQLDTIGGQVRFFDLGADSTAIVRAYRLLQSKLDRKFPLTAMFEHGTVRRLAAALSEQDGSGREELLAGAQHRAGLARAARRRNRSTRRVPATREGMA